MAERVHNYYGVPETRLFTTYLPLQARFSESTAIEKASSDRQGFLYPANLWPHKNHERLLAGYAQYRDKAGTAAWPLVLSGHQDPERKAALEREARRLGLPAQAVTFVGFLDDADFAKQWKSAGAMVFPSLYEGFGMPLLEAMHFRVPIAASRTASIPEIAGDAALLFDPRDPLSIADALFQLSSRPDLRDELVKKGAERLRTFDADREAEKLVKAFFGAVQEFRSLNPAK
jgi:glycosyltransferase involved in cell wall biosynthesis